jgi:uncharacterized protein (TIGR02757 family)
MVNRLSDAALKEFLEEKTATYNQPVFIESDPISIPHQYSRPEDIEIAGFYTAAIAWGYRPNIIRNANQLMNLMDNSPADFIRNANNDEIGRLRGFVHRTFNGVDCVSFFYSLRFIYLNYGGLGSLMENLYAGTSDMKKVLTEFRRIFFSAPHQSQRTEKHVADVSRNSSAKRLNMFLRWMVRNDNKGVDFGLWKEIPASALYLPLDLHTGNVARHLGLITRRQNDWKAVEEVTAKLRSFDPKDPVKYDFALFGLGVFENFK